MNRDEAQRLTGARWSSTVKCPRQGAYSALGAIPSPRSEAVEGMLERGHDLEDVYHRHLEQRYSGQIIREVAYTWGAGWELHLDFLLPELERDHREVKSNRLLSIPGPELELEGVRSLAPVLQVAGAAVFDPEGGTASVAVISPTNYLEREYPVTIGADLEGMVLRLRDLVVHAVETGELPERVCSVPSDGIGRFCPFVDTCFSEWEALAETRVDDGPVAVLAGQLRAADEALAAAKETAGELTAERDELRRQLRDYLNPGIEYVLGGVRVKRTVAAKGSRSFKFTAACAAGAIPREDVDGPLSRLGSFVSESKPAERWTVGDPIEDVDE